MSVLDIWMNGVFVGQWHQKGRTASRLVYDPSWVNHPQGRPLSLSLPMTGAGDGLRDAPVDNYFDNLLPDNEAIRRRIGARFKVSSLDAFTLLQSIGRDAAGAVQLLPKDSPPGLGWEVALIRCTFETSKWPWLCALKMLTTVYARSTGGIGSLWANGISAQSLQPPF